MTSADPSADSTAPASLPDFVDILPSPRILQVLGDIEFEEWQCVAELADNSFDEFLDIRRAGLTWPEFIVTVTLPTRENPNSMEVRDSGRGMTLDDVRDAVRAGWTGNEPFDKLGLFGMGFNIASARLGTKTTVLTKRAGEPQWTGVEIDLRDIVQRGEFKAPVRTVPADDQQEHGTRVIVSTLKPDFSDWFQRNAAKLRTKLGDVYSYLLEHEQFKLYVAGQPVKPRRPCVWDETRAVIRRRYGRPDEVPAVIQIDSPLPDMAVCTNCRHWQDPLAMVCEVCGSSALTVRERRVWGWLGIQRYIHRSDFGIDFLRNGRKILMRSQRLFEWEDPNSSEGSQKEYPIEVPANEGRIVGEIHLDHVPVNYQKNAFEYHGREWRTVTHLLRGDGPIREGLRNEFGYNTANDSPMARLFDGYRRNDPGLNYLTPGNGLSAIQEKARQWAELFRNGDPDYQDDHVWYEAAERHDELKRKAQLEGIGADEGQPASGDVLTEFNLADQENGQLVAVTAKPTTESEQERQERFRSAAVELHYLSAEYSLPSVGTLNVTAYLVRGPQVADSQGNRVPVYLSPRAKSQGYYAFIDAEHPAFRVFGSDYADFLLFEVAYHLKTRASSAIALGELVSQFKQRQLPDLRLDIQVLAGQARSLLHEVCLRMAEIVGDLAPQVWDELNDQQRNAIETRMVKSQPAAAIGAARESGAYLRYLPPEQVALIVQAWPELWLDGLVFQVNFASLAPANEDARQVAVGRVVSYLNDVALLSDGGSGRAVAELQRSRYTLNLLSEILATGPTPAAA